MKVYDTNDQVLKKAQMTIIARGNNDPNYPIERHLEDMDLIADLTELRRKYGKKVKEV